MSTQIQFRRGSSTQSDSFTGALGEITVDTTNKTLRVHDGSTSGGTTLATQSNVAVAHTKANLAFGHANSSYDQANAAVILAQGAFNSANNVAPQIAPAFNKANSAYDQANTATTIASGSFNQANSGFDKANTATTIASGAFNQANAAFDVANTKLNSTGGTISGNLTITGNLNVTGNVTTISANNLIVNDNMIYLNDGDNSSNIDLGIAGNYNDGQYKHTGLFRDASDGIWKFYDNYLPEPDANVNIDTSNSSFRIATVQANLKSDVVFIRGYDPINHANAAFDKANTATTIATGSFNQANSAFNTANAAVAAAAAGGGNDFPFYMGAIGAY